MTFNFICLGVDVAKKENCFSGKGDWTLFKVFTEDGKEFYLNLNIKNGEGEMVKKEDDIKIEF